VGGVGFDQAAKKERAPVYVPLIASDCEEGASARVPAAEDATLVHASAHHDAPPLPHRYVPPKTRPELKPSSAEAPAVAEEFNDAAVRAFKEKEYQRSYVLWPLLATDGHQWPLMASNGLLWPLMASDGL
jgi:hypothetical protein